MSQVSTFLAVALSLALAVACNRSDLADNTPVEPKPTVLGDGNELVRPRAVTVEGCLTGSSDGFVLTQLKGTETELETETYRLVGKQEELRPHIGRHVRVTGEAEPEQVVDVREHPLPVKPEAPAGTSGRRAEVETTQTTRIDVHNLRVLSISARDEPCAPAR